MMKNIDGNWLVRLLIATCLAATISLIGVVWGLGEQRDERQDVILQEKVDKEVFFQYRDQVTKQLQRNEEKLDQIIDILIDMLREEKKKSNKNER